MVLTHSSCRRPAKKAFTLLELIVVLVVLALLATLAVPTFARVIERSKDARTITTLQAVARNSQALAALSDRAVIKEDLRTAGAETSAVSATGLLAATLLLNDGVMAASTTALGHTLTDGQVVSLRPSADRICAVGFTATSVSAGSCMPVTGSTSSSDVTSAPGVKVPGSTSGGSPAQPALSTYAALVKGHGAASYWSFDEVSGSTSYNDSISTANATPTDKSKLSSVAPLVLNDGAGRATSFAYTDLTAPNGPTTSFSSDFTLEGWFQPSNLTGASGSFDQMALMESFANGTTGGYGLTMYNGALDFFTPANRSGSESYGGPKLSTTAPNHVVLRVKGSTATAFLNGVPVLTNTSAGAVATTRPLVIGNRGGGAAAGASSYLRPFSGVMDNLATYNLALTDAQVLEHYKVGTNTQ